MKQKASQLPEYLNTGAGVQVHPRGGLLYRLPSTAPHITALNELQTGLAAATVLYEKHDDGGRIGVYKALEYSISYLASQGIPYATLLPLTAAAAAMVDAERGIESPIFRAARNSKGGAPPKPALESNRDECLAVITECCARHCKANRMYPYMAPAAKMAADIVNSAHPALRVTAIRMREVRESVQQRRPGTKGRQAYDSLLKWPLAKRDPLAFARRLAGNEWFQPAKPFRQSANLSE